MQQENPKVVTVVWSGGFDSTFVLLDECDKANKDPSNIYIQCVTTSFDNTGPTKNAREKDARDKIKRYISRTYPSVHIKYANLEMKWDNNGYRFNSDNDGISQPVIWICSLLPLLDRDTTVKFGYIKSDDAMSSRFKQDVVALFDAANKLVGKNIKLEFPLECYDKNYVISYLMNDVTEVFEYCTSCENPGTNDKCGHCVPCQHIRETLIKLCVDGSPSTRKSATRYLKDWFDIDVTVVFNEEPLIKAEDDLGVENDTKSEPINDEIYDGDIICKSSEYYEVSHTPYIVTDNTLSVDIINGYTFPKIKCKSLDDVKYEVALTAANILNDIKSTCNSYELSTETSINDCALNKSLIFKNINASQEVVIQIYTICVKGELKNEFDS